MDKALLELYSDYLLSLFGATPAPGLSVLMDGAVSPDQVTRFRSQADYDGRTLWQQVKRKSPHTKNEWMRQMLRVCQRNQIPYRYVLADSWFSAKDNLTCIRHTLRKHFVVAL